MRNLEFESLKWGGRRPGSPADPCVSETARRIGQSLAYMRQHLGEPVQVATLAAQANISPSHFFVLFKRQTGCAPIDYFIRLRMQEARRLLDGSTLNVKEIAARLGYDDPFYFSRVFKSVHRVSPSRYRSARLNCSHEMEIPALAATESKEVLTSA